MDQDLVVRVQQATSVPSRHWRALTIPGCTGSPTASWVTTLLAEDVTQQALLDIWRDIRRLATRPSTRRGRIACSCGSATPRPSVSRGGGPATISCPPTSHGRSMPTMRWPTVTSWSEACGVLSMDHRVVLALRHLLGMPPEEVAATLGVSRWTVYKRLHAATEAMRAALEADARTRPRPRNRRRSCDEGRADAVPPRCVVPGP